MNDNSMTLLLIEKGQRCIQLINKLVDAIPGPEITVVATSDISKIPAIIKDKEINAVIFDFAFQGESAPFNTIKELSDTLPIVVMADPDANTDAIKTIHQGAQDCLIIGNFDGKVLIHTIRSAIERQSVILKLEQKSFEFQAKEAKLLNVIVNNADGIIVVDKNKGIRFANPAAEKFFSCSAAKLLNQTFKYKIDTSNSYDIEILKDDGTYNIVDVHTVKTEWEGQDAFLISLRDITERKHAERKLRENEERYALAIEGSNEGVWDWDLKKDEMYFSSGWKSILGYSDEDILDKPEEWFTRIHLEDLPKVRSQIDAHKKRGISAIKSEHRLKHKNGTYKWVIVRGSAVFDEDDNPVRMIGSLRDISEYKDAEEGMKDALEELKFALASEKVLLEELDKKNKDLVELSITDGLTGLFNHRFIQERFDFEFKRAKRYKTLLSCMMIDIDHFKRVNDNHGHQFGDFVLREISSVIQKNTREVDLCGRYGGEEFLIITTQDSTGAMKHAEKLHKAIETHLFQKGEHSIHITVSIGISEFQPGLTTKQEMIEHSDRALYQAKQDGRNLIRVWKEKEEATATTLDVNGIQTLQTKLVILSNQMRSAYMESTNALLKAVDAKDKYTLVHSENVSRFSVEIAHAMNIDKDQIEIIRYAALLHDIGKIGIDKEILVKKGPLTSDEFEILKKHPMIGVSILKDIKFLEKEIPIIQHHHEWYNGSGYPQGLKGREIPFGALILSVADAYDAMNTDREYKSKLPKDKIINEFYTGSGIQFAPEIITVFIEKVIDKL